MRPSCVLGLLAPRNRSDARRVWNAALRLQNITGSFDIYPTKNFSDLELRLSEMFLHERRGYVVAEEFQSAILPLLDELDPLAIKAGRVDTVVNAKGILQGYFLAAPIVGGIEERLRLWTELHTKLSSGAIVHFSVRL